MARRQVADGELSRHGHDTEFELGLKCFPAQEKIFNPSSNSTSRLCGRASATCCLAIHLTRDQHGRGLPHTPRHTPTSPVTNAGEAPDNKQPKAWPWRPPHL